jgi:hypothetical protein
VFTPLEHAFRLCGCIDALGAERLVVQSSTVCFRNGTEALNLTYVTHASRDTVPTYLFCIKNLKRNLGVIQRCSRHSKDKQTLNYPVNNFTEAWGCGCDSAEHASRMPSETDVVQFGSYLMLGVLLLKRVYGVCLRAVVLGFGYQQRWDLPCVKLV